MALSWYLKRLRTFSAGEIFYRIRQRIRTHVLDLIKLDGSDYRREKPGCPIVLDADAHCFYPIFDQKLDIFKEIDWHLDLSTGKRFPQSFAHKIDIRSDRYGSAKHVWEVNRMQFLLHIALLYKSSGDIRYLVLFCHHLGMWRNANRYLVGVNWYSNIEVNLRLICWYFCWQVLDIVKGKAGALTCVLLGVFSLMGLFELIDLASSGHTAVADENKEPEKQSASA